MWRGKKKKNRNKFFKPAHSFPPYIFADIDSLPSRLTLDSVVFVSSLSKNKLYCHKTLMILEAKNCFVQQKQQQQQQQEADSSWGMLRSGLWWASVDEFDRRCPTNKDR